MPSAKRLVTGAVKLGWLMAGNAWDLAGAPAVDWAKRRLTLPGSY